MAKGDIVKFEESIRNRIFSIRGFQVMLDRDLAELYGVETKRLNEAVKRNKERFPESFCFQLFESEKTEVVANCDHLKKLKFSYVLPYAFTEHGVVMLSSVLRSDKAMEINIKVVEAFVAMRKFIQTNGQIFQRLDRVEVKLLENDHKFEKVFDAYKFVSDLFRSAKKSIVIIDGQIVYHFGASLKDLGKKLFGFTKMDKSALRLIEKFIKV